MRKIHPGVLSLVLVLGFGLIGVGCELQETPVVVATGVDQSARSAGETSEVPEPIAYQVGDIISIEDTLLVVLGWDQPSGGDFNAPAVGKKYIAVDVLLVNQGQRPLSVSPLFQMSLKDGTGKKFNLNGKASAAAASNPPNGELNPGEIVRGKVGFQVPEGVEGLTFVYEADLIGLGEVNVQLGPEPSAVQPPQDLLQFSAGEVYQVGDTVQLSDLDLEVLGVTYPQGTELINPREGFRFLLVEVRIQNQGDRVREITSAVQMSLKDGSGQQYTLNLGAQSLADAGLPDDELAPGEVVRGQIGFQVPVNARYVLFVFDPELIGYGKAFIALTD